MEHAPCLWPLGGHAALPLLPCLNSTGMTPTQLRENICFPCGFPAHFGTATSLPCALFAHVPAFHTPPPAAACAHPACFPCHYLTTPCRPAHGWWMVLVVDIFPFPCYTAHHLFPHQPMHAFLLYHHHTRVGFCIWEWEGGWSNSLLVTAAITYEGIHFLHTHYTHLPPGGGRTRWQKEEWALFLIIIQQHKLSLITHRLYIVYLCDIVFLITYACICAAFAFEKRLEW